MFIQRRSGRRSWIVGTVLIVLLIQCVYFLFSLWETSSRFFVSNTQFTSPDGYTQPSSAARPKRPSSRVSKYHALSKTSSCALKKVSMLYGTHKYPQMEAALDSHQRHCDRWGCEFESLGQDLTTRKLYSKHYFLLSTMLHELSKPLQERKQWLMWVDADSIIINPAISPCIFLPPDGFEDVFALVTADNQGLNNGIFFLRVHPSSVDLLTQTIDYPLAHPDEDLGWFGEQAAMAKVIKSAEARWKGAYPGLAWMPREWFNRFELETGFEGKRGDLLVHFAGLGASRLSHMAYWLDELQKNQANWEVPIEKTFYKAAVSKFWKEFAANATKGR